MAAKNKNQTAPATTTAESYLTIDAVAVRLGVSQDRVRVMMRSDGLESLRLGHRTVRITETALAKYLATKTRSAEEV